MPAYRGGVPSKAFKAQGLGGARRQLRDHARAIRGKAQLFINAFAKALEVIPRQLCDNSGFDATDVLNKLRQKHAHKDGSGRNFGVDVNNGALLGSAEHRTRLVGLSVLVVLNRMGDLRDRNSPCLFCHPVCGNVQAMPSTCDGECLRNAHLLGRHSLSSFHSHELTVPVAAQAGWWTHTRPLCGSPPW